MTTSTTSKTGTAKNTGVVLTQHALSRQEHTRSGSSEKTSHTLDPVSGSIFAKGLGMKSKTRFCRVAALATLALLAGCASSPRALPGSATEAAVFFTPQVRDARAAAGHVFPSQQAEYARRDTSMGIRGSQIARVNLYPPRRETRSITRIEQTRVTATNSGYRITERSQVYSTGTSGHRHR